MHVVGKINGRRYTNWSKGLTRFLHGVVRTRDKVQQTGRPINYDERCRERRQRRCFRERKMGDNAWGRKSTSEDEVII